MHLPLQKYMIYRISGNIRFGQVFGGLGGFVIELMADGIKDLQKRSFVHGRNNLSLKELLCASTENQNQT